MVTPRDGGRVCVCDMDLSRTCAAICNYFSFLAALGRIAVMPIDGCIHSFQHLANTVLPEYMQKMRKAMQAPSQMAAFAKKGCGEKGCLKALSRTSDFPGCYVLIENGKPVYVGISRGLVCRLIQHVRDKTHFGASLAYLIASKCLPHKMKREEAMQDPAFQAEFNKAQLRLRSFQIAFIEIQCPVELYAFELYCSLELDTDQWNTFETH